MMVQRFDRLAVNFISTRLDDLAMRLETFADEKKRFEDMATALSNGNMDQVRKMIEKHRRRRVLEWEGVWLWN